MSPIPCLWCAEWACLRDGDGTWMCLSCAYRWWMRLYITRTRHPEVPTHATPRVGAVETEPGIYVARDSSSVFRRNGE